MADTIIGENITVDGEISGDDPVVIEGNVKGVIDTESTVVIADEGIVEADVETDQVEVRGHVNGNINARDRAEITPEGRVVGDIVAPRILIADGASFSGHIDMNVEE